MGTLKVNLLKNRVYASVAQIDLFTLVLRSNLGSPMFSSLFGISVKLSLFLKKNKKCTC